MPNKFSIAMCTYNGARYLREQLDSIAAQTRAVDELVICDDGSTDATQTIIRDFADSVPFVVQLHINEHNFGSTKNFEQAIDFCTGDLIALCDQDDAWLPGKLRELEVEFDRASKLGLIFTDAEVIDENSRPRGYTLWEKLPVTGAERERLRSRRAIDTLLEGSIVTGATVAFRSRFKDLILPIPDNLSVIHDAWIAMLIAAVAEVLPLERPSERPLMKYRQHGDQQVGAKERKSDKGGVREAVRRTNSYEETIEIGKQVQQRLVAQHDAYKTDAALSRLESRLAHLRARADLPVGKLSRARCVFGELLSRRYHLYSNGFRSAVKDLLA